MSHSIAALIHLHYRGFEMIIMHHNRDYGLGLLAVSRDRRPVVYSTMGMERFI